MLASASFSSKRPLCLLFGLRFRSPYLWFCLRCYIVNDGPDLARKNPSEKINNQQPFLYRSLYERKYEEIYVYREYFMESAGVRYLRTSCWRIRNRTSERSERVRFLIQKQRARKYRTKHFPCGIVFIIYILRHSSFWRPFYFKSFKNAKICRYTLTAKWQRKRSISFLVKTFVKNINDGKDMG